jgi:hypothetical protein
MMPGAGGDVNTTLTMILSCVGFVLCCGPGDIAFIIAFVFALQAGSMKKTGDIEGARAKNKTAMTVCIIGFVIGVIGHTLATVWNFVLN